MRAVAEGRVEFWVLEFQRGARKHFKPWCHSHDSRRDMDHLKTLPCVYLNERDANDALARMRGFQRKTGCMLPRFRIRQLADRK